MDLKVIIIVTLLLASTLLIPCTKAADVTCNLRVLDFYGRPVAATVAITGFTDGHTLTASCSAQGPNPTSLERNKVLTFQTYINGHLAQTDIKTITGILSQVIIIHVGVAGTTMEVYTAPDYSILLGLAQRNGYKVLFYIDQLGDGPIYNVHIEGNDGNHPFYANTDPIGIATFTNVQGIFDWSAGHINYLAQSGSIHASDINTYAQIPTAEVYLSLELRPGRFGSYGNITVTDSLMVPLDNVSVCIDDQFISSDITGIARVTFNRSGNHTLSVGKAGYVGYSETFNLAEGGSILRNIVLNHTQVLWNNLTFSHSGFNYFSAPRGLNATTIFAQTDASWIAVWNTATSTFDFVYAPHSRSIPISDFEINEGAGIAMFLPSPATLNLNSDNTGDVKCIFRIVDESSNSRWYCVYFQCPTDGASSRHNNIVARGFTCSEWLPLDVVTEVTVFDDNNHQVLQKTIIPKFGIGDRIFNPCSVNHFILNIDNSNITRDKGFTAIPISGPGLYLIGNSVNQTINADDFLTACNASWIAVPKADNVGFSFQFAGQPNLFKIPPFQAVWVNVVHHSVSKEYPTHNSSTDIKYLIDCHSHCRSNLTLGNITIGEQPTLSQFWSQGSVDANQTFEEDMIWHTSYGFDATYITNHCLAYSKLPFIVDMDQINNWNANNPDKCQALPGIEWTTTNCHILMLGITSWETRVPIVCSESDIENAIRICHEKGGIAILAHPPSYNTFNWSFYKDAGIDGVEVVNNYVSPYAYTDYYNDALANNLIVTTGTDEHDSNQVINEGWTEISVPVDLNDIFTMISAGQTTIILDSEGTNLGAWP